MSPKMPTDLDHYARKKWRELVGLVDPEIDGELIANYARMHGSLMAIRSEKARQLKAGTYEALAPGRDKTLQLNPLQVAENRMVGSLNRMLRTLGLAPTRDEQEHRKKKLPQEDEIDMLQAMLMGPYGVQETRIWREIRRGKVEDPKTAAERVEYAADQAEADRRLEDWKRFHGILDDGWVRMIRAPREGAGPEEHAAYHAAHEDRHKKLDAALSRAGIKRVDLPHLK